MLKKVSISLLMIGSLFASQEVYSGWNMIGVAKDSTPSAILKKYKGSMVWQWDNKNKKWLFYSDIKELTTLAEQTGKFGKIDKLEQNDAYWLYVGSDFYSSNNTNGSGSSTSSTGSTTGSTNSNTITITTDGNSTASTSGSSDTKGLTITQAELMKNQWWIVEEMDDKYVVSASLIFKEKISSFVFFNPEATTTSTAEVPYEIKTNDTLVMIFSKAKINGKVDLPKNDEKLIVTQKTENYIKLKDEDDTELYLFANQKAAEEAVKKLSSF